MSSTPALAGFYPSKDHRTSVPLSHQQKAYDSWGSAHGMNDGHDAIERKDRSPPKETASNGRRSTASRLSYTPSPLVMTNAGSNDYMKTNPKSAAPLEPPFVRDSSEDFTAGLRRAGNRWSFNGSEKTIDSKIGSWDLVDEIGKLSIANGPGTGTGGTTTPSKSNVLQIHEASPLETSSSETSLDSNSPSNGDSLTLPSHSRDPSTDTMASEESAPSSVRLKSLKTSFASDLTKDRPRSFSGALTDTDLRRLQNIPTPSQMPDYLQEQLDKRDVNGVDNKAPSSVPSGENLSGPLQPMYPSLATYPNHHQQLQPQQQPPPPYMAHQPQHQAVIRRQEELENTMTMPRQLLPNGNPNLGTPFMPMQVGTPGRQPDNMSFRQQQQMRAMGIFQPSMQMQGQPPLIPSPTNFAYPAVPGTPGHHNALSLGTSQQMYNMMIPMDPAVNRTQQTFRAGHQHSASDPASIRDAATSMLLSSGLPGMQGMQFTPTPGLSPGMSPGMYPPMAMTPPLYPNQFFPNAGPQGPDIFGQQQQEMMQAMARAAMPQYTGSSVAPMTPQTAQNAQNAFAAASAVSPSPPNSAGPSANNRKLGLYKTELCRSWEEKGSCRYGPKCQFAHGEDEIRKVQRHPKYKTEICRTFWVSGSCPYGKRCCFIHTELPVSGTPPGADGSAPPQPSQNDGRARSMSTNSDPNDSQTSLLARITARRKHGDGAGSATPTAASAVDSPGNYQYAHKPPSGALRVDTNVEAPAAAKQNKSAYPTFANSSMQVLSPGPVTAGPEFGRMLGSSNAGNTETNTRINGTPNANPRHAYTNSEASISYGQQPRSVSGGSSPFGMLSSQTESPAAHGHSRSGSVGNWGSFAPKNSHLSSGGTPYAHTPSPGSEAIANAQQQVSSPWGSGDASSGPRHGERAWA